MWRARLRPASRVRGPPPGRRPAGGRSARARKEWRGGRKSQGPGSACPRESPNRRAAVLPFRWRCRGRDPRLTYRGIIAVTGVIFNVCEIFFWKATRAFFLSPVGRAPSGAPTQPWHFLHQKPSPLLRWAGQRLRLLRQQSRKLLPASGWAARLRQPGRPLLRRSLRQRHGERLRKGWEGEGRRCLISWFRHQRGTDLGRWCLSCRCQFWAGLRVDLRVVTLK